jgi:hypothetical protein
VCTKKQKELLPMRLLIFITVLTLLVQTLRSQDKTETLISGDIESGGFGAPVVKFSSVRGEIATYLGIRGGWVVNRTFVIGGGLYALATEHNANTTINSIVPKIRFGNIGLEMEYINDAEKLIHWGAMLHLGLGGVSLDTTDNKQQNNSNSTLSSPAFVLEPSATAEVNVTSLFRIMLSGSYRLVGGVNLSGVKNSDLSGPSMVLTFKFGVY